MSSSTLIIRNRFKSLYLTYGLGLILVLLSSFGAWYDPVNFERMNAWQIGLYETCDVPFASFKLLSYGGLIAGLVFLGGLSLKNRDAKNMHTWACLLAFFGVSCYLQMGISCGSWLDTALRGAADFENTVFTANSNSSPLSFDRVPDPGTIIPQQTLVNGTFASSPSSYAISEYPCENLVERFIATLPCMSFGWTLFMIGVVVVFFSSWQILPKGMLMLPLPLFLRILLGFIFVAQITEPIIGSYFVAAGDVASAHDKIDEAVRDYRKAIAYDEWYQRQPSLFLRIGELQHSRLEDNSPEALFYLGTNYILDGNYEQGMDLLSKVSSQEHPCMEQVLKYQIGELSLNHGFLCYSSGQLALAHAQWMTSVQAQPNQTAAYYFLGETDTQLGNYKEAQYWYQQGYKKAGIPVTRALYLSSIGDTYYLQGDHLSARRYFLHSLIDFFNDNYRSTKSLVDPFLR